MKTFNLEERFAQHTALLKEIYEKNKTAHDTLPLSEAEKNAALLQRAEAVEAVWHTVEKASHEAAPNDRAKAARDAMWDALQSATPGFRAELLDETLLDSLHEILPRIPGQIFRPCVNTVGRTRTLGTTLIEHQDDARAWPEAANLLKKFGPKEKSAISPSTVRDSQITGPGTISR